MVEPVKPQAERERIADWLWAYANLEKWRDSDSTDEIRHFVGHAMDYIKAGWYTDEEKWNPAHAPDQSHSAAPEATKKEKDSQVVSLDVRTPDDFSDAALLIYGSEESMTYLYLRLQGAAEELERLRGALPDPQWLRDAADRIDSILRPENRPGFIGHALREAAEASEKAGWIPSWMADRIEAVQKEKK